MSAEREAKTLMIQGTTSNAGKTTVVAGLCRMFESAGYSTAPFKGWNLSLNSGVTPDGGEIGRGQLVQAEAARVLPTRDMNPVLVKPQTEGDWQTIIRGKVVTPDELAIIRQQPDGLFGIIKESLRALRSQYDVVIIEGSGSPAEPNLMQYDIANMRVAKEANAPVLMVANIDPQGAYASLLGTMEILKEKDPEGYGLVKGFIINKFRGQPEDLKEANDWIKKRTGIPVVAVLNYFDDLRIDEEDSMVLTDRQVHKSDAVLDIVVPLLETMQNTDDIAPFSYEPGVHVRYIRRGDEFGVPDLVIIPGSKNTISDLHGLERSGIAEHIKQHAGNGGAVIGICGGYQMLGESLVDPDSVESTEKEVSGLKLLPITTVFERGKITEQVRARLSANRGLLANTEGIEIEGYEIHMGRTKVEGETPLQITTRSGLPVIIYDGSVNSQGNVVGSYVHGAYKNDALRKTVLNNIARSKGKTLPAESTTEKTDQYDRLANHFRKAILKSS